MEMEEVVDVEVVEVAMVVQVIRGEGAANQIDCLLFSPGLCARWRSENFAPSPAERKAANQVCSEELGGQGRT